VRGTNDAVIGYIQELLSNAVVWVWMRSMQ
jgi:hypothetical protein